MALFSMITASLTTALGSAALASAVVQIGTGLLLGAVKSAFTKKPKVPRQTIQATISQAAGSRVKGVGLNKLGGTRALFEESDEVLHQIIVFHNGPINRVVYLTVNGERVDGPQQHLQTEYRDGTGPGGDYAASLAAFPTIWTTDHRLEGMATMEVRMGLPAPEDMSKIWPKGSNTDFAVVVETSLLYDPRTGLTEYSDSPALAIRDHLTSADGWNIPAEWMDDDTVSALANRCARSITLKDGTTEHWAIIGGYYTLDEECKTTTERMLQTCDGQVFMTPEGKIGLMGGGWSEPDVTLTDDDIIEIDLGDGRDPFEEYNIQKGIYVDPGNRFKETEVQEWEDTAALDTQPARVTEFEVEMCPSGSQLQRLMKIRRMRDRREWVGTIRTKLSGIKARFPKGDGAHIIRIVWSEMDIDGPFEVLNWQLDPQSMQCVIEVGSVENAWNWISAEQTDPPTMIKDLLLPTEAPKVPIGLVVQQEVIITNGQRGYTQGSETAVRLVAYVNDPGRPSLRPHFRYRDRYGDGGSGDADWRPMNVPLDSYRASSGVVSDNATYEVQARFIGQGSNRQWTPSVLITAVANPTPPAAPTGLGHTVAGSDVTLTWTSTTARSRVFRSPTNSFSGASSVATITGPDGAVSELVDSPGTGNWWYWVVALNSSLVASSTTGPEAVAIT